MEKDKKIKGVYAAMLTPLNKDGSINIEESKKLVNFLIEKGVDGIFPVSSIGEGIHFSIDESVELAKAVCETANNRVDIVPGATTTCTYNTVKLINKYKELGCDTVVIAPPYFYSTCDDDVVEHYVETINQTNINVIVYNIPLFAMPISDNVVQKLIVQDNIVGIKDSSGSAVNMMQIINNKNNSDANVSVLTGREESFLSSMQMGAQGCMVGSASIVPEVIVAIKDAFEKGDLESAKVYQDSIVELVKTMFLLPFPMGFKIALEKRGFEMGGIRKATDYSGIDNINEISNKIEMLLRDALKNVNVSLSHK